MKKIPMRMCVACRARKSKKELIRVVTPPDGEVSVDLTGKKAGRGLYVCKSKECLENAVKANRLERGIRGKVPESVLETLWQEIEKTEKMSIRDAANYES